jgi:hypothetical protein
MTYHHPDLSSIVIRRSRRGAGPAKAYLTGPARSKWRPLGIVPDERLLAVKEIEEYGFAKTAMGKVHPTLFENYEAPKVSA